MNDNPCATDPAAAHDGAGCDGQDTTVLLDGPRTGAVVLEQPVDTAQRAKRLSATRRREHTAGVGARIREIGE